MKHFLILVILFVLASDASAQKPWKWMPLKGPNIGSHSAQLLVGSNGEIISVGRAGYYSTINDGISWDYHKIIPQIHSTDQDYLYSGLLISSTGEYYFYFSSSYDTTDLNVSGVYRSTDKGSTWSQIVKREIIFGIFQIANDTLLMVADLDYQYYIFESIDKGDSWTEVSPTPNGELYPIAATNKDAFFKLDPSQAYIDEVSLINKSYSRIYNGNYNDTTGLVVLNDNLILVFKNSRLIDFDGISQWDTVGRLDGIVSLINGTDNLVYALAQPDLNKLNIASSSDQGKNWSNVGSVSPYQFGDKYSFYCPNSVTLLYENDTALYLSTDRGSSWKEIGLPFDSINTALVANDGRIFTKPVDRYDPTHYVYNYFDAQLSSDKGDSWYKSEPAQVRINGIGKGINGSILAIAPDSNESWNSVWIFDTARRTQWQKRSVVQNVATNPLFATDGSKSTYLATNNYLTEPIIYRSDDNGFSWIDIEAPNTGNSIYSLDAGTDGTLYFGSYPVMYRSEDYGITWTKILPVNDIVKLLSIKTFGTSGVLLGTEGDGLLLSNDKGNSWARIDGKNFDTVTCIAMTSIGEIAAGTNRGLWLSDTTKRNWAKVLLGNFADLYIGALDVSNTDDFYVGTYGSSVWTGTRHYNSVKFSHSENPLIRISPNPASEKITVDLDLPIESTIKLELYDILGRRIALLADGIYSGENQIYFNSANLSSGIYTIILSGSKNESQKLVINR